MQACENGHRVADKTWAVVEAKLEETWSPQQISGYLKVIRMFDAVLIP